MNAIYTQDDSREFMRWMAVKLGIFLTAMSLIFIATFVFAADDADDIIKRHEKWIGNVSRGDIERQAPIRNEALSAQENSAHRKAGTYDIVYSGGFSGAGHETKGEYNIKGNELWVREASSYGRIEGDPVFGEWRLIEGFKDIDIYLSSIKDPWEGPDDFYLYSITLNGKNFPIYGGLDREHKPKRDDWGNGTQRQPTPDGKGWTYPHDVTIQKHDLLKEAKDYIAAVFQPTVEVNYKKMHRSVDGTTITFSVPIDYVIAKGVTGKDLNYTFEAKVIFDAKTGVLVEGIRTANRFTEIPRTAGTAGPECQPRRVLTLRTDDHYDASGQLTLRVRWNYNLSDGKTNSMFKYFYSNGAEIAREDSYYDAEGRIIKREYWTWLDGKVGTASTQVGTTYRYNADGSVTAYGYTNVMNYNASGLLWRVEKNYSLNGVAQKQETCNYEYAGNGKQYLTERTETTYFTSPGTENQGKVKTKEEWYYARVGEDQSRIKYSKYTEFDVDGNWIKAFLTIFIYDPITGELIGKKVINLPLEHQGDVEIDKPQQEAQPENDAVAGTKAEMDQRKEIENQMAAQNNPLFSNHMANEEKLEVPLQKKEE